MMQSEHIKRNMVECLHAHGIGSTTIQIEFEEETKPSDDKGLVTRDVIHSGGALLDNRSLMSGSMR